MIQKRDRAAEVEAATVETVVAEAAEVMITMPTAMMMMTITTHRR